MIFKILELAFFAKNAYGRLSKAFFSSPYPYYHDNFRICMPNAILYMTVNCDNMSSLHYLK